MGYWDKRELNKRKAAAHTNDMAQKYGKHIEECVRNTREYASSVDVEPCNEKVNVKVEVTETDSVKAVFDIRQYPGTIAVLNFASYKEPGGMFLEGSSAQEECLCHASFLYNVLKEKMAYYEENNKAKNKALYTNKALYSPAVMFFSENEIGYADVITCAAPNLTAAKKYCNVSDEENTNVLTSRIEFVLNIAEKEKVANLVLGAYGCGVFGQDPEEVAKIFKKALESGKYSFQNVVFAIPGGINLQKFQEVFNS